MEWFFNLTSVPGTLVIECASAVELDCRELIDRNQGTHHDDCRYWVAAFPMNKTPHIGQVP